MVAGPEGADRSSRPGTANRRWLMLALLPALAYVVVGIVTAELAGRSTTAGMVKFWRLAAWVTSFAVFGIQVLLGQLQLREAPMRAALPIAVGVAVAALVLAATGPLRAHWGTPTQGLALLALVLWPVLTGVPAFLAALVASGIVRRARKAGASRSSGS